MQVFKWSVFCGRVWENDRSVDNSLRFLQKLKTLSIGLSLSLVNPELMKLGKNITRLMQALYPRHIQMTFLE